MRTAPASTNRPKTTKRRRCPCAISARVSERGVDVDAVTEMVSVLDAQRAYEANASVFDIGKRLAERTIDMGRLQ